MHKRAIGFPWFSYSRNPRVILRVMKRIIIRLQWRRTYDRIVWDFVPFIFLFSTFVREHLSSSICSDIHVRRYEESLFTFNEDIPLFCSIHLPVCTYPHTWLNESMWLYASWFMSKFQFLSIIHKNMLSIVSSIL